MIKQLRSTSFLAAAFSFLSFLSANHTQACTGHDVIIQNITITSITSHPTYYSYEYTYQIKNIGTAAIALNQIVLQNYVSANTTFEQANDQPGGGSFIAVNSTQSLAAGATYTGSYEISIGNNYPVSSHPYFIIEVHLNSETECDVNNNEYSELIQVTTTATQTAQLATADVHWNTASKSFSVSNWSGSNGNNLEYLILSASGTLVTSGKTTVAQYVSVQALEEGIYIIFLSDGMSVYTQKIMY